MRRRAAAWPGTRTPAGQPVDARCRGRAGDPRGPRRRHLDVRARCRQAPGAGGLAERPAQPEDGAGHGQPPLAVPFRPGDRAHAQRLRQARRGRHAPRAARLAGRRADRRRLAAQADAPPDRALERLPDVVACDARRAGRGPVGPMVLALPHATAVGRGGARRDPLGQRRAADQGRRAERLSADPPGSPGRPVGAGPGMAGLRPRRGQPAEHLRRTSSGRSWSRSWPRTTRPTRTPVAPSDTRPRCRRSRSDS